MYSLPPELWFQILKGKAIEDALSVRAACRLWKTDLAPAVAELLAAYVRQRPERFDYLLSDHYSCAVDYKTVFEWLKREGAARWSKEDVRAQKNKALGYLYEGSSVSMMEWFVTTFEFTGEEILEAGITLMSDKMRGWHTRKFRFL